MNRRVEWLPGAVDDLAQVSDWRTAAAIDAAVQRFAREGVGFLRRVHNPDGADEWRLYAPGATHFAVVRPAPGILYVESIERRK